MKIFYKNYLHFNAFLLLVVVVVFVSARSASIVHVIQFWFHVGITFIVVGAWRRSTIVRHVAHVLHAGIGSSHDGNKGKNLLRVEIKMCIQNYLKKKKKIVSRERERHHLESETCTAVFVFWDWDVKLKR